jgi:futalosine hydrolase
MSLNILFVTATPMEADTLRKITGLNESGKGLIARQCTFKLLITGIGSIATSWALTNWYSSNPKPDLAINAGIAGSYREDIETGQVVVPVSDCFADMGVETETGFKTLAEAGLEKPGKFPFSDGKIISDNRFVKYASTILNPVKAISVNTSTGSIASRNRLMNKFNPDIETMEGAAFFYICSMERIPFLAIRSISNMVGPRDKGRWNIPLALESLAINLQEIILNLN